MRIYLVRHAQSWWQVDPNHDWDTSLTDLGHEQSRRIGAWVGGHESIDRSSRLAVAALFTSPLKRAQETTQYVADALGLPPRVDDRLREADFHVASQLPQAPHPLQRPVGDPTERYRVYRQQVESGWQALVAEAEQVGGPVLAVTHGGFIKTSFRIVTGTDQACLTLYNACVNLLEWRRGRWHLVYLNLWDHLPPELRTT